MFFSSAFFFCSWSRSWSSASERAPSCRSTPTRSCSRSQTTAPTSWSRSWTHWRSPAERATHSSTFFFFLFFIFFLLGNPDLRPASCLPAYELKDTSVRVRPTLPGTGQEGQEGAGGVNWDEHQQHQLGARAERASRGSFLHLSSPWLCVSSPTYPPFCWFTASGPWCLQLAHIHTCTHTLRWSTEVQY